MKSFSIVTTLFLAACSPVEFLPNIGKPEVVERSSRSRDALVNDLENLQVTFEQKSLPVASPEPVGFVDLPLCEASRVVLQQGLGLDVGCKGEGTLTFASVSSDPQSQFDLFVDVVTSMGGKVRLHGSGVRITGEGARDGVALESAIPGAGSSSLIGVEAKEVARLPVSLKRSLVDATIKGPRGSVVVLPGNMSPEDARLIVSDLGLDVTVTAFGERAVAVGDPAVLNTLAGSGVAAFDGFFVLNTVALSETDVDGLKEAYPDLHLSYDSASQSLRVSGDKHALRNVHKQLSETLPVVRNVQLEALLFVGTSSSLDELASDFGFDLRRKGASFSGGTSVFDGVVLKLERLERKGFAQVLARPKLVVRSGQSGRVHSGQSVPVKVVTVQDGQSLESYQYSDTGVSFSSDVLVEKDGDVRLSLDVEVSSVTGENDGAPVFDKTSVNVDALARQGDIVVLGGMDVSQVVNLQGKTFGLFPKNSSRKSQVEAFVAVFVRKVY